MPARASAKRAVAKPRPAVNTDRLTVDIVEAAANLLRAFAESPAGRRSHTSSLFLSVRLFATTGYGSDADQSRAREAGFERHLTKPVEPAELERVLAELKSGGAPEQ